MPLPKERSIFATVFLIALVIATGCKKPEDELGLSILDPADALGMIRIDSTAIITWPRPGDSVRTSGLSVNELGSYLDERFGSVRAGIVTQVRLSVNNVGPSDPDLVCDSLVLSLAFSTIEPIYGDPDPQTISVFRMNEDLYIDSIYQSNRIPSVDVVDLVDGAPRQFTPSTTTGPVIDGDTLVPQLRIPLSTSLGSDLLALWGQPELIDNTSFLAYFKGLYIVPSNGVQTALQGGVWNMSLLNGASKMTLYYHGLDGVATSFDFLIGTSSLRYTTSEFDHAAAPTPGVPQALADSTLGLVETYIQALGGLRTEVRFPFLDRYAGTSFIAVAKAELVVRISEDYHETYTPPAQLFAFRKADDGSDLTVPDQISGQGQVGGFYDADAKEYRLNLTRWVQGVINGTYPNTGLSLVPGGSGVSVARATLGGPMNSTEPMSLMITFTTY